MQVIEQLFFELLQVAIGTRKTLDRQPTSQEWGLLFDMSKKQALTAIAFTGVTRLTVASDFGASLGIPEAVYLKWLGLTAKVAQRNKEVTAACVELVRQYGHDGITTCILKGQGNLEYYPEELRECRTPGDIDVWCSTTEPSGIDIAVSDIDGKGAHYEKYHGKQAVVEYVKMLWRLRDENEDENENHEVRYHHIDAPSINTSTGSAQVPVEVEAHFRPLFLDSPLRNHRLQRWFKENEQFGVHDAMVGGVETKTIKTPEGSMSNEVPEIECEHPSSATSSSMDSDAVSSMPSGKKQEINRPDVIPVPTVSFNAVYQLAHIYRHLFDEGIGLRQLLDYYFVLRALHIEQSELADRTQSMAQWAEGMGIAVKSNAEIMHTLSRFGMKKFAGAVMWVLQRVLDPSQPSLKGQEFEDWQQRWPWMICEPNEKEGRFLLNEIMMAGNFGKYDERIKHGGSQFSHAIEKTKHNLRLLTHYPEEVMWEPVFRVYHWVWRRFELWRF